MISKEMLGDALGLGSVPDGELVGILADVLPLSRWESGKRVTYLHPEQGHVLDVVYDKHGRIACCEPGPGLTEDLVATLRKHVAGAYGPDAGFEIRRDVLFSVPEVKGFWPHGDDWQILPAPPQAPRPGFLVAEHPFVFEYRVRTSLNNFISLTRRRRRFRELHLLLSLVLRGLITREPDTHPHHWVLLHEPAAHGSRTAYLNEGYMVGGGFVIRADGFSDPVGHPKLVVVPDDEYYVRRGLERDDLDVPTCLDAFFDRFESADPRTRNQLVRASYWVDVAYRVWHTSKSLSFVAAINAVETLVPDQEHDPCPCCGRNRAPGPSAGFRQLIETHAAAEGAEARAAMYGLRSALMHGRGLHSSDDSSAWAALIPRNIEHMQLHETALAVSRAVIRSWFLNHDVTRTENI